MYSCCLCCHYTERKVVKAVKANIGTVVCKQGIKIFLKNTFTSLELNQIYELWYP